MGSGRVMEKPSWTQSLFRFTLKESKKERVGANTPAALEVSQQKSCVDSSTDATQDDMMQVTLLILKGKLIKKKLEANVISI